MRPELAESYIENMTDFLVRSRNMDRKTAEEQVRQIARKRIQNRKVKIQDTRTYGDVKIREQGLYGLLDNSRDKVTVPSGSAYIPADKKEGLISQLLSDQLKQRDVYKEKQFEAKQQGDKNAEAMWKSMQKVTKIIMNALPGGFASPFNLFYDKGGYNAITSLARCLIAVSYTVTEQLLCGVFAWFEEEDVITHIINTLKDTPPEDEIFARLKEFNLKEPTKNELLDFFMVTVGAYHGPGYRIPNVEAMVKNLERHEVVFLYYYFNLKHIFMDNKESVQTWIHDCLQIEGIQPADQADTDMDDDLIALVSPIVHQQIKGERIEDHLENNTELGRWYTAVAHTIESKLAKWQPVFDTFVYRRPGFPTLNQNKSMIREGVIISDTDSVIFTLKNWVNWYTGGDLTVTDRTLSFSSFMVYWLTKVNSHEMYKFGERQGVNENNRHIMQMKNEFMYPSLLLFDKKKNYYGIINVQEGNVLTELDDDIKGGTLKGSDVSEEVTNFIAEFLKEDICKKSMYSYLSMQELIAKVKDFETTIFNSLKRGETRFQKIINVNTRDNYKQPESSSYLYYLAWEEIFAPKYGHLDIPIKTPGYKLFEKFPQDYKDWLAEHYPETAQRMEAFIKKYKKSPTFILSNPMTNYPPEEVLPIIDVRGTVIVLMQPIYDTLNKLWVPCGHFKQEHLLLSDLY